ncbi:MAG TPA: zf-HC2 domain-containing protein [Burkholderiales bacterium]|nr:zf-HC2 domain-containing protein [Burkholderiales bacterium]
MMKFRLKCREASRLLSQAEDRQLGLSERLALRLHLGLCDACTQFSRQLGFLRRALSAYPGPEKEKTDST